MRTILLIMLPLLAACEITEKQREKMEEAEELYGPCILYGTGCPGDAFPYERISSEVATFKTNHPSLVPMECSCEESERCNRVCYLAIVKRLYAGVMIPPSSKRSSDGLTERQREMIKYVEEHYGSCILHGTGCPDNTFTYERISSEVTAFKTSHPAQLPRECSCEESERCTRVCYLAILKFFYANAVAPQSSK